MIGLAVSLNGKLLTVTGADDLSVLNAIVNALGELGDSTARTGKRRSVDLWLTVGGLTRRGGGMADEHLRWLGHKRLRVGDEVTVQVVRTDRPDKYTDAIEAEKSTARSKRLKKAVKERVKVRGGKPTGSPARHGKK